MFFVHSTQKNDFVNSYVYFSVYPTKILFRTMKSLVNEVNNAVTESLFGLSFAFPQLEYQESHKVVLMPNLQERKHKVSLICGGGSGHEPFAAGYVGNGMLAAAVAGSIYAAPPSKHISYAIDRVSQYNNTGILMVVPNYTGDCLNFGIAIEKARQKGLKISEVIVNEDCSIPKEEQGVAGKRGLTGIIFVMKIAGALAEQGLSLEEVTKTAHDVLQNTATYSVGLTACAIPGQSPMFELGEDEIEVGQGIHGEAGYEKMKLKPCSEIVAFMLKRLREALSLKSGDSVAVIINNFGALSQLEQGIVVYDVVRHLHGIQIKTEYEIHVSTVTDQRTNRKLKTLLFCDGGIYTEPGMVTDRPTIGYLRVEIPGKVEKPTSPIFIGWNNSPKECVAALNTNLSNGSCPVVRYTKTLSFGQDDCQMSAHPHGIFSASPRTRYKSYDLFS